MQGPSSESYGQGIRVHPGGQPAVLLPSHRGTDTPFKRLLTGTSWNSRPWTRRGRAESRATDVVVVSRRSGSLQGTAAVRQTAWARERRRPESCPAALPAARGAGPTPRGSPGRCSTIRRGGGVRLGLDADDLEFVSGVTELRRRRGRAAFAAASEEEAAGQARFAPSARGRVARRAAEGTVRFLDRAGFRFHRTPEGDVFSTGFRPGGLETISRGAHVAFVFAQGERGTRRIK